VSAPENAARSDERSARASDSSRASASNNVGGPAVSVGRFFLSRSATIFGLNCGTMITRAPVRSGAFTSAASPNPWKIGRTASTRSSGDRPTQAASCIASLRKLPCESMIPFGSPVVPPE
jgi:hypothetical protein